MNLPPSMLDCSTPQREYWSHVADQQELPIAPGRDIPRSMNLVASLASDIESSGVRPESVIAEHLLANPALLDEIRIFAGWSDKRLYLSLSYVFSRTTANQDEGQLPIPAPSHDEGIRTLCGCEPFDMVRHSTSFFKNLLRSKNGATRKQSASVIACLLMNTGIVDTLAAYASLDKASRYALLRNLVFTKESQQNEAKRRGHGAESLIASVLSFAGGNFLPKEKISNPMGSNDPNIDIQTLQISPRSADSTWSCDIAGLDRAGNLRAWVVSLVQSSDPGQFGVDKSNTTTTIRRRLDQYNNQGGHPSIELWGVVDGVGYSENKSGTIDRMLASFHDFFQTKTAYKAALAAHRIGIGHVDAIHFDQQFYDNRTIEQMSRYVPSDVEIVQKQPQNDSWKSFHAGRATLFIKT